jgi:hypothetical protein
VSSSLDESKDSATTKSENPATNNRCSGTTLYLARKQNFTPM